MPYVRAWIHYVWATKNREPVLSSAIRPVLYEHIKQNAKAKNIYLDKINDYYDHLHCLVSLGTDQTIEKVIQMIKGESSFWFNNKSGLNAPKLYWQDEYFAVSVSESVLNKVREYIDGQEIHHQKKTFAEEYQDFINKYSFTPVT